MRSVMELEAIIRRVREDFTRCPACG
jgi:hypothetical protein